MPELLLAIDVGNTNLTLGLFQGRRLLATGRLLTDPRKPGRVYARDLRAFLRGSGGGLPLSAVVYASVVPPLDRALRSACRGLAPRWVSVSPRSPLGVRLKVRQPRQVGADRLLNALAAWKLYGGPAVVVDFGTATTFDCLSARGEYLGGAILPGPRLAARALALATAKLPEVEVIRPKRVVGKDTRECIQAGLYYGYLGMIERVLDETVREMGGRPRVLATGGLAGLFAPAVPRIRRIVPDLTLQGLRLAYELLVC